jgi:hypothetical protein
MGCWGSNLVARDVQVDLVATEVQRLAFFPEGHEAHAESFDVEPHRRIETRTVSTRWSSPVIIASPNAQKA